MKEKPFDVTLKYYWGIRVK